MPRTSPTQRSLALLRREGWKVAVVERWNAHAGIRQDLFGGIDLVAVRPESQGVLGVQATSAQNVSLRVSKLLGIPELRAWVQAGNRLVVHGWAKRGPRGARKVWTVRVVEIGLLAEWRAA